MKEPEMIHRNRTSMPPKLADETQRINLLADRKWLDKIDDWRKRQEWPSPTRSDAIRILVEMSLDRELSADKPKKKPKG
jgi:metal-responsive CopG/Arc/MetJ family transcriptional regulator